MVSFIIGAALFMAAMMNLEKLGRKPWLGILIMSAALALLAYGLV